MLYCDDDFLEWWKSETVMIDEEGEKYALETMTCWQTREDQNSFQIGDKSEKIDGQKVRLL